MSKIDKLPLDAMNLSVIHDCTSTALHFVSQSHPHRSLVYNYCGHWEIAKTHKDDKFLYVELKEKSNL